MKPDGGATLSIDKSFSMLMAPAQGEALLTFTRSHIECIRAELLAHGAILFRGFRLASPAEFALFGRIVGKTRLEYTYRSTPRTEVGGGIYTATEYPSDRTIPLHSENAYQREWPLKIAFWCRKPATEGGRTPLADLQRVTKGLPAELLEEFSRRGVRYVRHYHPHLDLPWQTVFQTEDPGEVERYCAAHHIDHQWLPGGVLRTAQLCQGVARHPLSGERVFFNQAHLFHLSSLKSDVAAALVAAYGELVPRHATYGDGGEITVRTLEVVRQAFSDHAISFAWAAGDVLLIDNMRIAHGRMPYVGPRDLLALLMEAHSDCDAIPRAVAAETTACPKAAGGRH